jgi:AP-3 complex subunit sigma
MINAVLVFNNAGQLRLTKFYTQLVPWIVLPKLKFVSNFTRIPVSNSDLSLKFLLLYQTDHDQPVISYRKSGVTVFLMYTLTSVSLPPLLAGNNSSSTTHNDTPSLITYRHYATLYFIVISTSTESPLALLDLIQVFVEALDRMFENVCEFDLIFNFETLHATLAEIIVGGVVVETNLERIVEGVKSQGRVAKRPKENSASGAGMMGKWGGLGAFGGGGGGESVWTGR